MTSRHTIGKDIRNDDRNIDYLPTSFLVDNLSSHSTNGEKYDSVHNLLKYRNYIANYTTGMHHKSKNDPNDSH